MRVLGVDPGGTGALALLINGKDLRIEDMPVLHVKKGRTMTRELYIPALVDLLSVWQPDVCYFELVGGRGPQPTHREAAKAAFNFGRISGACEAIVKSCGAQFHFVPPRVWKGKLGLAGKDAGGADQARGMASDLFPGHASYFLRKKDDGRADAALIAWFGWRRDFPHLHREEDLFA